MSHGHDDHPTFLDWEDVAPGPSGPRRRLRRPDGRLRPAVLAALGAGLLAAPFGVAATGDALREGERNGTATRETQIIADHSGAATRQSNKGSGLAAVYGCRRDTAECTRHVNLKNGPAAAFVTDGNVPFSVDDNTGLVANLNADKVDGLDAAQLRGATGPAGPAGPAGAQGPQGPAGPTASASAARTSVISIQGSNTVSDSAVVRTTITTGVESRLVANATGTVIAEFGGAVVNCWLVREVPPTFFTGDRMSQNVRLDLGTDERRPVAATGALVVPAGTHQVGLHCVATGAAEFEAGDLTVVAAGT